MWQTAPRHLILAENDVHVWRGSLERPLPEIAYLQSCLTPDEQERANRFHFDKDRHHFIAGRGMLRHILSRYLNIAPAQFRFTYNQYNKPSLAAPFAAHNLYFNLSHSGELALYALAHQPEIGIDIERLRTNFAYEEVAERFFAPPEVAVLRQTPTELKAQTFFNCWTRKEAYIKAHGMGLSLPLDSFVVTLQPGQPVQLLLTRDDPAEAAHWTLQALMPGPGYAAALAMRRVNFRLTCWQWPP